MITRGKKNVWASMSGKGTGEMTINTLCNDTFLTSSNTVDRFLMNDDAFIFQYNNASCLRA